MAYYSSTEASSNSNPPRLIVGQMARDTIMTQLTTMGSTATNSPLPRQQGGNLWFYSSTNLTTDITAAGFFTDGWYLGMRPGDAVYGTQWTSQGSSIISFIGSISSASTAGATLSTGGLITSTFG